MSRVLQRTIQERKARVNVESMVSFDGISQYASAGVNQNVSNIISSSKDFSISFFVITPSNFINTFPQILTVHKSTLLGFGVLYNSDGKIYVNFGQSSETRILFSFNAEMQKNYHVAINYTALSKTLTAYNNTVQSAISSNVNISVSASDLVLWIARRGSVLTGQQEYSNCKISHLTFFNRVLTLTEIKGIHRTGGLLPESVHSACIAHYPCNEQNGKILNDIVEDYNYAKTQFINDPNMSLGLAEYNVANSENGETFEGPGYIGYRVTVNSSNRIRLRNITLLSVQSGVNYTVEIDWQVTSSPFPAYGASFTIAQETILQRTNGARGVTKGSFTATSNTTRGLDFSVTSNVLTGIEVTVYGLSICETETGKVISSYPATLQNFTDAEVGIPDQSTNTAWRDFYTKQAITSL